MILLTWDVLSPGPSLLIWIKRDIFPTKQVWLITLIPLTSIDNNLTLIQFSITRGVMVPRADFLYYRIV